MAPHHGEMARDKFWMMTADSRLVFVLVKPYQMPSCFVLQTIPLIVQAESSVIN